MTDRAKLVIGGWILLGVLVHGLASRAARCYCIASKS